jgi:hypothetical protein
MQAHWDGVHVFVHNLVNPHRSGFGCFDPDLQFFCSRRKKAEASLRPDRKLVQLRDGW